MNKRYYRALTVRIFAYIHRWGYPILMLLLPLTYRGKYLLLIWGVVAFLYALHSLIGYICRWRHIYCSYQIMHREQMTPQDIRWQKVKRGEIYATSVIFGVLGIGMVVSYFYIF